MIPAPRHADASQDVRYMQLVYTAMGRLGQQFLLAAIESATSGGLDGLRVEHNSPEPTLPDCIEVLRMMYQQVRHRMLLCSLMQVGSRTGDLPDPVHAHTCYGASRRGAARIGKLRAQPSRMQVMMAVQSGTWPLLHLVSIGCHMSVSELLQRLVILFRHRTPGVAALARSLAGGFSAQTGAATQAAAPGEGESVFASKVRELLESGGPRRLPHAASDTSDASRCIKAHLSRSLSRSLVSSSSRIRSFPDAARLVSSARHPTISPKRNAAGKSGAGELMACCEAAQHEFPVLFIVATANTMLHMVDVRCYTPALMLRAVPRP